jgi:pimeloyl-ACP methyl ester carboxylesterase
MTALGPAVTGERFELSGRAGRLNVYVAGAGPPLLLIHSVNAAASVAEVKPLFERYKATRTVYAPDLPGFGFSDRSDRVYTPRLMTDALHVVVEEIHRRSGRAPLDALAVSLGSEFLARAAVETPDVYRSLALVSPTGFAGTATRRAPAGSTRFLPWFHKVATKPGWGGSLFRQLTRPSVIRFFLRKTWGSDQIDDWLWQYDIEVTRQPGAENAPLYFLAGGLFSADIHAVYQAVKQPVWVSHGVRGDFVDFRSMAMVRDWPNWRVTQMLTGAMPYFELTDQFCATYDEFLGGIKP